jgi:predicted dienelactone hydrolase
MKNILFLFATLFVTSAYADAYKPDVGPHRVSIAESVTLPAAGRDLTVRVAFPDSVGQFPLVVLSHGGGCYGGSYSLVGDHWASHGYVVIQPTHPDSASVGFDMATVEPRQMEGIIRQRVADMSLTLDHLAALEAAVPDLQGRMNVDRVVAAGHSMGGATALLATGLSLENPFSRQRIESDESRYDALLLLSEPGGNPTLPDEPWRYISVPTFIYTGTDDYGSESRGENSRIPFQYNIVDDMPDAAPAKHYLWIEGINHYLSGGWCRVERAPDYDAEASDILKGVSTAFLDAYAKDDGAAMNFLSSAKMPASAGNRPTLSQK